MAFGNALRSILFNGSGAARPSKRRAEEYRLSLYTNSRE